MPSYIVREGVLRERAINSLKAIDNHIAEVLHPSIRAYLLLQNATLRAQARISVLNMCDSQCKIQHFQGASGVDRRFRVGFLRPDSADALALAYRETP